jgi:peptide/nickel transport system permease protein
MTRYIIRSLIQAIAVLFVISLLLFGMISIMPGGLLTAYAENPDMTAEDMARLREKYGLDDPLPLKYVKWVTKFATGDLGASFVSKQPVIEEIKARLPNTILLMGTAFILTLLIAIPLGVFTALRQYSLFDHVTTTLAFAGQSLPVFWFGLLLIIIFSVVLKKPDGSPLLPGSGMATLGAEFSLVDRIEHLILPVTMLAVIDIAAYMRYVRSAMLEVINQDYIRTARGKGLPENRVIYEHALRNALIPVVTLIALNLPILVGGAVFTETIFSWPGMGRLFVDAALKTDYPVVMAVMMLISAIVILSNLAADLVYAYLDPRIRYS